MVTLNLTPEQFKVVWEAMNQYADNQAVVDAPSEEPPQASIARDLVTQMDAQFLDLVQEGLL